MDNLHRSLAPISQAAWAEIEEEASRSFKRSIAGRRLVDVKGPLGLDVDGITRGHRSKIDSPADGIEAYLRQTQPMVELKVPFSVTREAIDDVDRGAADSDWEPVVRAARELALAEDRAIFEGYLSASITGIKQSASLTPIALPSDVADYPEAVSQGINALRLASVDGPYSLALSADAYALVNETSNDGYPVRQHLQRILDTEIIWAPALSDCYLISTRGGDFELTLGQDISIGYDSHDGDTVNLYFLESFTYVTYSDEAVVPLITG